MPRTLLVAREDEVKVRRVVDGVEDGENGAARVAKNMLDVVPQHHLVEDFPTAKTDERMVQELMRRRAIAVWFWL